MNITPWFRPKPPAPKGKPGSAAAPIKKAGGKSQSPLEVARIGQMAFRSHGNLKFFKIQMGKKKEAAAVPSFSQLWAQKSREGMRRSSLKGNSALLQIAELRGDIKSFIHQNEDQPQIIFPFKEILKILEEGFTFVSREQQFDVTPSRLSSLNARARFENEKANRRLRKKIQEKIASLKPCCCFLLPGDCGGRSIIYEIKREEDQTLTLRVLNKMGGMHFYDFLRKQNEGKELEKKDRFLFKHLSEGLLHDDFWRKLIGLRSNKNIGLTYKHLVASLGEPQQFVEEGGKIDHYQSLIGWLHAYILRKKARPSLLVLAYAKFKLFRLENAKKRLLYEKQLKGHLHLESQDDRQELNYLAGPLPAVNTINRIQEASSDLFQFAVTQNPKHLIGFEAFIDEKIEELKLKVEKLIDNANYSSS